MSTLGFEFAYMIDGGTHGPLIQDFAMAADASGYVKGDLCVVDSNGRMAQQTGTFDEVSVIVMETETDAVSNDDELKCAIITPNQVWRCSMDATSTTAKVGYTKTLDIVDENTIDADDITNGQMTLLKTGTDDDGNVLAYVTFSDTTWGNA